MIYDIYMLTGIAEETRPPQEDNKTPEINTKKNSIINFEGFDLDCMGYSFNEYIIKLDTTSDNPWGREKNIFDESPRNSAQK